MSLTPKAKLKARLAELTASIDALPDDVLSNDLERDKVQGQISKLQAAVETPMETVTSMMFQPHKTAAAIIALKAKWLHTLADGKPKTADDIAAAAGGDPELIARIMNVLAATGVVDEQGPLTYALNSVSETAMVPGWTGGLSHFFEICAPILIQLPGYLARTGYAMPQDVKTGPFTHTHGRPSWAFYDIEPDHGDAFNVFMTAWREGLSNWFDRYPVERQLTDAYDKSEDTVLLVDVGGGQGHVVQSFVTHKGRRKNRLIVQDRPAALSPAEKLQPFGIEAMPYDFFTPQPVKGAKVYYFRQILHDWSNKACQEILRNTTAGMKRGYSKILIDEMVLPDTGIPMKAAFLDLSMMALECGAERTSLQWHDLLGSVGLRIVEIWRSNGPECLIEAELA